MASAQIKLHRIDGWRKIAAVLSPVHGSGGMIIRPALGVALTLCLLAAPAVARAQQGPSRGVPRVGFLHARGTPSNDLAAVARSERG